MRREHERRTLVVDDDPDERLLLTAQLAGIGRIADAAAHGEEAWERLDADPESYELVIVDRAAPVINGTELLKRLRADRRFARTPVVIQSAAVRREEIAEGRAAGAHCCLPRPADDRTFAAVIRCALGGIADQNALRVELAHRSAALSLANGAEFSFRTLDEARAIAALLASVCRAPENAVTGFSEILVNAVEHGNLEIDYSEKARLLRLGAHVNEVRHRLEDTVLGARRARVSMKRQPSGIRVTVTDEGRGFDWRPFLEFDADRAFDLNGRGIAIARQLAFDSLEYFGRGNVAVVTAAA